MAAAQIRFRLGGQMIVIYFFWFSYYNSNRLAAKMAVKNQGLRTCLQINGGFDEEVNMHKTLRTGLILLLMIAGLVILAACAKKVTTVKKEASPPIDRSALDREQALAQERQRRKAQQQAFQAAKTQFMNEDIYFKKGSYRLQPEARAILKRKAEFLKTYPDVRVLIEGHTDERGSKETNIAFGDRRAGEVKSFLIREGIERQRLIPVSFGKERPVEKSRTDAARTKNRRVHFVVLE